MTELGGRKVTLMKLIELWLKQSGTLPIQFSIFWPSKVAQLNIAIAVLCRLEDEIPRWQNIIFCQPDWISKEIPWPLRPFPRGTKALALNSASFTFHPAMLNQWIHGHTRYFNSILDMASNLQSLTRTRCFISRSFDALSVVKLKRLTIYHEHPSFVLHQIQLLPHLKHLEVCFRDHIAHTFATTLQITHLNIQILHLSDTAAELLEVLTLPSLLEFSLTTDDHWPQAAFDSLMQRSSSKLTTLNIHCKHITAIDINQCLHLPYLEHFRLRVSLIHNLFWPNPASSLSEYWYL
ncbi:hypothetical protein C8J56DRAFT_414688 [Mycena floridula]|nr:hypothetical protein C8J56DRAFT_414688 [Mycena floridula]